MEIQSDPMPGEHHRRALQPLYNTCFVSPKATGLVSLIIQFAILIISTLVSIFFFYHVGGYEYMSWNENSTILEPIYHHPDHTTMTTTLFTSTKFPEPNELDTISDLMNETMPLLFDMDLSTAASDTDTNDTDLLEQIPNTTIYINFVDAELDMLELIRISTLVYLLIAVFWLISLLMLLLSIKVEVLDFVATNAIFLTVALLYALIHALFIAVLLYYQRNISWRTMAIVIGSVAVMICTSVFGAICLALTVGWYKYIVYMNDTEQCYCLSGIVRLIKGRKREQPANDYVMPEITPAHRNLDIPYADEPPVNNFSSF